MTPDLPDLPALSPSELAQLPIFPLPEVALFPDTLLPLHIFEPRYRDLMAWCLERDAPMAIAQLRPGYEPSYYGRPDFYPVAGAGRVHAHELRPDGSYDLILRGVARVKMEEELADPLLTFRTGRFTLLQDCPADPRELDAQIQALRGLLRSMLPERPRLAQVLLQVMDAQPGPTQTANVLSSLVLATGALRQTALEAPGPRQRLDAALDGVIALLPRGPFGDDEEPC